MNMRGCLPLCKTVAKQTNRLTKVWQLPSGSWLLAGNLELGSEYLNPNPYPNLWAITIRRLICVRMGVARGRPGRSVGQTTIVITHLLCQRVPKKNPRKHFLRSSVKKKEVFSSFMARLANEEQLSPEWSEMKGWWRLIRASAYCNSSEFPSLQHWEKFNQNSYFGVRYIYLFNNTYKTSCWDTF